MLTLDISNMGVAKIELPFSQRETKDPAITCRVFRFYGVDHRNQPTIFSFFDSSESDTNNERSLSLE